MQVSQRTMTRILDTLNRYENHLGDMIIQESEQAEKRRLRAELRRVAYLYNQLVGIK